MGRILGYVYRTTEWGIVNPATRNNGTLVNYWVDGVRFFEGEYEPYFPDQAVSSAGKLAVAWGGLKVK